MSFLNSFKSLFYANDKLATGSGGGGSWGNEKIVIPETTNNRVIRAGQTIADSTSNTVEKVKDVVTVPFDIIGWMRENWQLSVLGIISIIVLLRK